MKSEYFNLLHRYLSNPLSKKDKASHNVTREAHKSHTICAKNGDDGSPHNNSMRQV
jgi:hypothetical protein